MREIKFRCFDKQTKQMSPSFTLFGEFLLLGAVHAWQRECGNLAEYSLLALKDLEVMQYSGLKDKHGKEIYEGDVIQYDRPEIGRCFTEFVVFDDGCFMSHAAGKSDDPNYLFERQHFTVIGNIYENPELCQ